MSNPSLFDAQPEPTIVDVSTLGDVTQIYCTSERGFVVFERGRLVISPDQFFGLSRTLSRKPSA